jgi:hypothetical protein
MRTHRKQRGAAARVESDFKARPGTPRARQAGLIAPMVTPRNEAVLEKLARSLAAEFR